ncbi:FliH/SctL family protein [Collimonas sp.]|jgi:flagellar assembly protein FliH|uniref:FliH/SctL family protein n=1 Tax=Collimonas sp. TaxID=1963772 RepID=UPI002BC9B8FC|nr:FliH/SctL family protein [Collimonas sp.]HWW08322.1 FliH/SctL family protein [Collimonas sp.]
MTEKDPLSSKVLHKLELHPLPRVLSRPGRTPESKELAKATEPLTAAPGAVLQKPVAVVSSSLSLVEIQERAAREGYEKGLSQAREDGHSIGKEEGFRSGREEGLAAAEKESLLSVQHAIIAAKAVLHKQEQQLLQLAHSIPAQIAACLASSEDDMVALVHESVCRIAGKLALSPGGVRQIVSQAMAQLRASEQIVIRLHPADCLLLTEASKASPLPGREVSYLPDNQVSLGGCLIDYPQGTLDARLETQLRQFTDLLLHVRQSAAAAEAAIVVPQPAAPDQQVGEPE